MPYELMVVAATGAADSLIARVEKLIKDTDARDLKVDRLGRKKLAFPIRKHTEADYYLLNFDAESASLKTILDKLRLEQEDLLRHLVVKKKEYKVRRKSKKALTQIIERVEEKPKVTVLTKTLTSPQVTKAVKGTKVTKSKSKTVKTAR